MGQLLSATGAWGTLAVAVIIFGFAPGMVLSLVVRLLPEDDPRRRELQAELYAVPRWERPFWVCEQLEVAMREGLFPDMQWYWGKWVWHRSKIESGLERHREYPDSFWVPEDHVKAELGPGDHVKLMWAVKRMDAAAERMWVRITHRDGDKLVGELDNWAVFVHLALGERVKFHIDDIIDYTFAGENDEPVAA